MVMGGEWAPKGARLATPPPPPLFAHGAFSAPPSFHLHTSFMNTNANMCTEQLNETGLHGGLQHTHNCTWAWDNHKCCNGLYGL